MRSIFRSALVLTLLSVGFVPATSATPKDKDQEVAATARSSALFDHPTSMKSTPGATIDFDGFLLENNLWNAETLPAGTYEQSIFYRRGVDGPLFGWRWSFTRDGVNAYPEIIYGWKPWFSRSTTTRLPRPLVECGTLKVDYSIDLQFHREGSWNLAFDNWITSGPGKPLGTTTKFEMMIWEDRSGIAPFGSPQGTLKTTNGDYTLYVGEPTWEPSGYNWTYLAFVRADGRRAGTVDVGEMIKYLLEKKIVPADHYLASIEFGNEAGNSACAAVIDTFSVRFD